MVVPFGASYLGSYKVIPKSNYNGAHGYSIIGPQTPILMNEGPYIIRTIPWVGQQRPYSNR